MYVLAMCEQSMDTDEKPFVTSAPEPMCIVYTSLEPRRSYSRTNIAHAIISKRFQKWEGLVNFLM